MRAPFTVRCWEPSGFVLLIVCANLTNLMLARSVARSRELSSRIALGAGRWRIIRQVLVESVILAGLGGIVGWWIARWSVRIYEATSIPPETYNHWHYTFDLRVFAYCLAISAGTGILFGVVPALNLSNLNLNTMLKDGGRGVAGPRRWFLSSILVAGEMALAIMLLSGAGVMVRSFLNLYNMALGVDTNNIVAADVNIPTDKYPSAAAQISLFDRLQTSLASVPGVQAVAVADAMPANGSLLWCITNWLAQLQSMICNILSLCR